MTNINIVTASLDPKNTNDIKVNFSYAAKDATSVVTYNNTTDLNKVSDIALKTLNSQIFTNVFLTTSITPNQNPQPEVSNIPQAQSSTNSETVYSINSKSLNFASVRASDNEPIEEDMVKVPIIQGAPTFEVSNPLNRFDGTPVFFEMVDSAGTKQGVWFQNKYFINTLKLTPNPDTLTITSSKKVNRYTTLTGWIEEHWGDDIDTISLSGSTFSFFNLENGLTYEFRDQTPGYNFIKELIHYYQVNGCIYQGSNDYEAIDSLSVKEFLYRNPEFVNNHPRKGMMKERLYIKMYYDYLILFGRFETFDIIEDAAVPFRFKYNIIFKAERTIYNLDRV